MNKISEGAREWETFKYDSFHIHNAVVNDPERPIPFSALSSSPDAGLTAFAQLGALRLNASRALISLFDRQHQYIVAEATRSMPLAPNAKYETGNHLWLCGTAIPRAFGICEHVLVGATTEESRRPRPRPPSVFPNPTAAVAHDDNDLPVAVIPDLAADQRFCDRPYIDAAPHNRFYAGVPIRSPKGINIGVYCIFNDRPRSGLDADSIQFMREISKTVMDYLDARRVNETYRRSERMVHGLGDFIRGKDEPARPPFPTSCSNGFGTRPHPPPPPPPPHTPSTAADLVAVAPEPEPLHPTATEATAAPADAVRPSINPISSQDPADAPTKVDSSSSVETTATAATEATTTSSSAPPDPRLAETINIFSRAANVIRESLEVDGALFLDASVGSYGGLVGGPRRPSELADNHSSSSDDSLLLQDRPGVGVAAHDRWCRSFGRSSVLDDAVGGGGGGGGGGVDCYNHSSAGVATAGVGVERPSTLRERFLRKLLRRYPNGKVFSYDDTGTWYSGDSEEVVDDADITPTEDEQQRQRHQQHQQQQQQQQQSSTRPETRAAHSYFARRNEAKTILDIFPGARSVAVVPLWDHSRERCYAGGFVWSRRATRILTPDADLPYLRAFGMVTMAEIIRLDAMIADKAKTDILGSLSHELRSPLHGVVAAAELLHDTQLDAFQVDVIHTIEISGKTLLDTIDHLLDYSKVNTFLRASSSRRRNNGPGRGLRQEKTASIESGMMTLVSDIHLDLLAEEVIESVFIGHSFQHMVASQLSARHGSLSGPPTPAQEKLDAIATSEGFGGHRRKVSETNNSNSNSNSNSNNNSINHLQHQHQHQPSTLKDVKILVDIDPDFSWVFHTQPGALRRIIMNLFGNALKYTSKGFIKVSLRQEEVVHTQARSASMVVLTVTDSGKGISEEFLRSKLFTPFSQEDALAPGTGLGLSLVRQIVATLGGTISVRSQLGHGTSVTVSLPLLLSRKPGGRGRKFSADLSYLAGRRLSVRGFSRGLGESEELRAGGYDLPVESLPFKWLGVDVSDHDADGGGGGGQSSAAADLTVCSEEAFRKMDLSNPRGNDAPLVVVCPNAEAAQKLATSYRRSRQQTVMEFIAQPTGPRKVAKALACALDRWQQRQVPRRVVAGGSSPDAFAGPSTTTTAASSPLKPEAFARPRAHSESIKSVNKMTTTPPAEATPRPPMENWSAQNPEPNFTLTLPFRPPAVSAAAPATSKAMAAGSVVASSTAAASSASAASAAEFLLVDDNPINLKILSAYMKRLKKRHATASNGLEALETYTTQPQRFCCILIDITMPVMDGLEATRRIRRFERARQIPPVTIIAITSLGSAGARQEGFASGMDLFLTRPVTVTELVKILKQRRLVDDEAEKDDLVK